jgi:hypothetical protein
MSGSRSNAAVSDDEVVVTKRSKVRDVAAAVTGWSVPVAAGYFEYNFLNAVASDDFRKVLFEAGKNWGGLEEFLCAELATSYRLALVAYNGLRGNQAIASCKTAGDLFRELVLKGWVVDALSAQLSIVAYNGLNKALGRSEEEITPLERVNVKYFAPQAARLAVLGVVKGGLYAYASCRNCFFSRSEPAAANQAALLQDDVEAAHVTKPGKST